MKKRLLITSIVMMLVVAVALSTATYAWFTSNASVTANNITISAGTSNAPSLSIAWIPTEGSPVFGTTLPNIVMAGELQPIAPSVLSNTSGSEALLTQSYYTASIRTENSVPTFNAPVVDWDESKGFVTANTARPYYLTNGTSRSIRLKNGSTVTNMSAVEIKANITGSAAKLVRIAVYNAAGKLINVLGYNYTYTEVPSKASATYSSTTDYYKLDAHGHYVIDEDIDDTDALQGAEYTVYTRNSATTAANATYGTVTANHAVSDDMTNFTCATSFSVGQLNATDTMDLTIVMWLDGAALNDETQGFTGTISLDFTATAATVSGS